MPERRYYHPTARGLEQRIGEALERLRNPKADPKADPNADSKADPRADNGKS